MRIQQFLEHHGIGSNPFADEDAQTDLVFKGACIRAVYHPAWDKIYGDPSEPATAVVFGEKGSGKTAVRMQIARRLEDYNADHPDRQVFVVQYDDFNPFLDRFRERFSSRWRRRMDWTLGQWRLWDHIDAVLALAVTQLVDRVLGVKQVRHPAARDEPLPVESLDRPQGRDLLLLAACYDQSTAENVETRWHQVRRKLRFPTWRAKWSLGVGIAVTMLLAVLAGWLTWKWQWRVAYCQWMLVALAAGWLPHGLRWAKWYWQARRIVRSTRVLSHNTNLLRRLLMKFAGRELIGQPLPSAQRTDDRYELLAKLQGLLRSLRLDGLLVLVDRVDEPYLVNGSTDLMQALVWPMLDNKFLKHPGLGIKLLLPSELERLLDRQPADFHQRARLDKQNLVRSLQWTGQSLFDLANARLKACAGQNQSPGLAKLFEPAVSEQRLKDALGTLRVPRHVFKFMYRLLTTHCNAHGDEQPVWQISSGTFESVLALYQRDQDASDRGAGAG
ncbi:MAG: hypothetical protein ABSG68_17035 [Thermoguttaceae bacterium]|jgi:hypothetical protein